MAKKSKAVTTPVVADPAPVIIAYKGFDKDLACHPDGGERVQYEVGKTYTMGGDIKACQRGYHSCENPLDVFIYYSPGESRFCEVEISGQIDRKGDDSKIASAQIAIKAELHIPDLVARAIKWIVDRAKPADCNHATGNRSASSATGYSSASSATGDGSASSATGNRSASSATGYSSASSATGDGSASSATGNSSASSATGDGSASSATGNRSASSATGYSSASSATGDGSASSATGNRSASSATGNSSASSATGDRSASSATGYSSASSAFGPNGAAMATGFYGRVQGAEGCALFLTERNDNGDIIAVWAGIAGRDGIEPLTFYTLKDGKPVKVEG